MDAANLEELLDFEEYIKISLAIFAIANPFVVLPIYLGMTRGRDKPERIKTITTACVFFIGTGAVFSFFGVTILAIFGITVEAFMVAGGLLILFAALDMVRQEVADDAPIETGDPISIGLVPIGMPLLGGPGMIASVVVFAGQNPTFIHQLVVFISVIITAAACFGVFYIGDSIGHLIRGKVGLVMQRVLGLILLAIAIELIMDGIGYHFEELTPIV